MRLEIKDLHVHYDKIEAIKGISIVVNEGEIVTLIGERGRLGDGVAAFLLGETIGCRLAQVGPGDE